MELLAILMVSEGGKRGNMTHNGKKKVKSVNPQPALPLSVDLVVLSTGFRCD